MFPLQPKTRNSVSWVDIIQELIPTHVLETAKAFNQRIQGVKVVETLENTTVCKPMYVFGCDDSQASLNPQMPTMTSISAPLPQGSVDVENISLLT